MIVIKSKLDIELAYYKEKTLKNTPLITYVGEMTISRFYVKDIVFIEKDI